MSDKTGGSAFPMPMTMMTAEHIANEPEYGMTLRDYFAAKAMQGRLAGVGKIPDKAEIHFDVLAKQAYAYADAMLKAREA